MSEYQRRSIYCLYEYTGRRSDAWIRDPAGMFAIECFMDDIAKEIGMDPLEFRKKNLIKGYYEDAYLKPIAANTNGIFECLERCRLYPLGRKTKRIYKPDR